MYIDRYSGSSIMTYYCRKRRVILVPCKDIIEKSSRLTTSKIDYNESFKNIYGLYMHNYTIILDGLHSSQS